MASVPTIRGGAVCCTPLGRARKYRVGAVQFEDFSEQTWKEIWGLDEFDLTYTDIDGYDLGPLLTFFIDAKGAFDSTLDLTIGAVTWNNLALTSDKFVLKEGSKPNLFSLAVRLTQTKP